MELKIELQELELDKKRVNILCDKIAYTLSEEKISIYQALEILEETKKYVLKSIFV